LEIQSFDGLFCYKICNKWVNLDNKIIDLIFILKLCDDHSLTFTIIINFRKKNSTIGPGLFMVSNIPKSILLQLLRLDLI
tara:strand:+ start:2098 stop:2337 length:240 start_codon:yes stop_codon:yes gene_type:complete